MSESNSPFRSIFTPGADQAGDVADHLRDFIRDRAFPCVGAKSALSRDKLEIMVARSITSAWDDLTITQSLLRFVEQPRDPRDLVSFAVVFADDTPMDEQSFEKHLWERIQSISDKDRWLGQPYDGSVSSDPDNPHFSLSFGGQAFFVVGLHPGSSRKARRFERPVMVFNLHDQFERLREQQRYEKMRETILERDLAFSGSINPMLSRHGDTSEARQYSGRAVGEDWRCPFSRGGGDERKANVDAA